MTIYMVLESVVDKENSTQHHQVFFFESTTSEHLTAKAIMHFIKPVAVLLSALKVASALAIIGPETNIIIDIKVNKLYRFV